MSEPIEVVVIGEPKPQGSKRAMTNKTTGQAFMIEDNPGVRAWRRDVKAAAKAVMGHRRPIAGPCTVDLTFRLTRPRTIQDRAYPCVPPDLDKLVRAVFDAITKVAFYDDALVAGLVARKLYAENLLPGATIVVKEVG